MTKGESRRTLMICVDSMADEIMDGRFFCSGDQGMQQERPFHGLMQLLISMDACLSEAQYPMAFDMMRTFAKAESVLSLPIREGEVPIGKIATFSIRILFRQNASWQGSITWVEGRKMESFRSVLELVFLMNSALHGEAK